MKTYQNSGPCCLGLCILEWNLCCIFISDYSISFSQPVSRNWTSVPTNQCEVAIKFHQIWTAIPIQMCKTPGQRVSFSWIIVWIRVSLGSLSRKLVLQNIIFFIRWDANFTTKQTKKSKSTELGLPQYLNTLKWWRQRQGLVCYTFMPGADFKSGKKYFGLSESESSIYNVKC